MTASNSERSLEVIVIERSGTARQITRYENVRSQTIQDDSEVHVFAPSYMWRDPRYSLIFDLGHGPVSRSARYDDVGTPIYDGLVWLAENKVCGALHPISGSQRPCGHRGEHKVDDHGYIFHLSDDGYWWTERTGA